jgi:hypothetical protein
LQKIYQPATHNEGNFGKEAVPVTSATQQPSSWAKWSKVEMGV